MNMKKSSCGQRKKSASAKSNKQVVPVASINPHKQSYQLLTRNPSKAEGLESNYSVLMDTYTELMAKKRRSNQKKTHKKELSQSFHMGQKPNVEHKSSYLETYLRTVNRYMDKENLVANKQSFRADKIGTDSMTRSLALNQFYTRRNTAD